MEGHTMKTVRRLLHGEIITAVAFVAAGFLALFMFFDLVDELQSVARHAAKGYGLQQALLYIALKIPEHLYQLLPLSVLIGCIFVMARLAQSSEFTILRTGGLDPLRALGTLLRLGLIFVGLTFVIGDYIAPWADRQAIQIKAIYQGHLTLGQTGAWLKENQQDRHFAVNVRSFDGIEHLRDVRIHEFNDAGQLLAITTAEQADIENGQWALRQVEQKRIVLESSNTVPTRPIKPSGPQPSVRTWSPLHCSRQIACAPGSSSSTCATCPATSKTPSVMKSNSGERCSTP
jgi:lipopolysaccharide export system permease protein